MQDQCVIAEYDSVEKARLGLEVLEKSYFTTDSVSVVYRKNEESLGKLAELEREAPDGRQASEGEQASEGPPEESSTGLGMLIGGGVAAPIAAFTMVGPVMLAGPIAGAVAGAAVGGAMGNAHHWGVNKNAREQYEKRVQEGAVLVIVTGDAIQLKDAEQLLSTTEPRSINRFAHAD